MNMNSNHRVCPIVKITPRGKRQGFIHKTTRGTRKPDQFKEE